MAERFDNREKLFGLRDDTDGDEGDGVVHQQAARRGDRRGHIHELEVAGFEILNELFHQAWTRTVAEPTGRCNRRGEAGEAQTMKSRNDGQGA